MQASLVRSVQRAQQCVGGGRVIRPFSAGAVHKPTPGPRAHRLERTVFAPSKTHTVTMQHVKMVKMPLGLNRNPALAPRPVFQAALTELQQRPAVAPDVAGGEVIIRTRSTGSGAVAPAGELASFSYSQSVKEHAAHIMFISGMAGMGSIALVNGLTSHEVFFTAELARAMVSNIPIAGMCAGMGDIVAQVMTGTNIQKLDIRRVFAAGLIGGVLQGVGTTAWLWHLNMAIPRSLVGFDSLSQVVALAGKVIIDSALWGTTINTLNVGMRRIAAGDSLVQAHQTWSEKLPSITRSEFKFWPAYGSMVYTCVPDLQQVNVFGIGGFIWSVYLSYAANHGVTSNSKGLFRYGAPKGVRTKPIEIEQTHVGRLIPAAFNSRSSSLPLHGSAGRPRVPRTSGKGRI